MSKYVFAYHGGSKPIDEAEVATVMQSWGDWFASMGDAVVDTGNPVGVSTTIHGDGSVSADGGSKPLSGYSLTSADSLEEAVAMAKGCPILAAGGSVELAEAVDM